MFSSISRNIIINAKNRVSDSETGRSKNTLPAVPGGLAQKLHSRRRGSDCEVRFDPEIFRQQGFVSQRLGTTRQYAGQGSSPIRQLISLVLYQTEQPWQNKAGANSRQTHANGSESSSGGIDFKRSGYTDANAGAT